MKIWIRSSLWLVLTLSFVASARAETGYYRYPTLARDTLVFASEGDLWRAPATGGAAVRLTSHPEEESSPALSPDGRWLAFNAHYDGPTEVYVMPAAGGAPKRLTFEGGNVRVIGWTPDGRLTFASGNNAGARAHTVRVVNRGGGIDTLPLQGANDGTFSDDGKTFFFTRYGLALTGDNVLLYRGGLMAQLWWFRQGNDEAVRLAPDFGAPIRHPMHYKGRLYFVSDKSGSDNVWSISVDGEGLKQHTKLTDKWQIKTPKLFDGQIVYQRGADIYRFNIADGKEAKLRFDIISDRDHQRVRWLKTPLDYLESGRMSANGMAVALTARGRVAVASTGPRRRVELPVPLQARARGAVLGAKGDWAYAIIDIGVRAEIWRFKADGRSPGKRIAVSNDAHIFTLYPSPDGARLLFDDKKGRLWSLDLKSRRKRRLEKDLGSGADVSHDAIAWSPDSRYAAYRVFDARGRARVAITDLITGRREIVTSGKYDAFAPAFSPDGKWLYFVSDRNFDPRPSGPWGDRNMGPAFAKRGRLYALALDPKAKPPFVPKDELAPKAAKKDKDNKDKKPKTVVRFKGLRDRLWPVNTPPGDYRALAVNDTYLYVLDGSGSDTTLKSIKIDPLKPKTQTVASKVRTFELSANGKTLFIHASGGPTPELLLIPAEDKAPKDKSTAKLRVGDWRLEVSPRHEWRQMFIDAWRMHRDFAYDRNLRGIRWKTVRHRLGPLVERIGHRSELDDVLGQMAAQLGILHSQVRGGDFPVDAEAGVNAFLGADFAPSRGGLRITQIYDGEDDLPETLGPLHQPGVDVREGDILTAVNGRRIRDMQSLRNALVHTVGQRVRLDLQRNKTKTSAIVVPVDARARSMLLYRHWVESRRQRVVRKTKGKIGYLHLRAMGPRDIASFARDFYDYFDSDAVIIDVRNNRGGNIDSWIIGTLLRRAWAFWMPNIAGRPFANPQQVFRGHLVVLINEGTYSDGETFSAGIKALKRAPLIGTRTAGAGIWLSGRNRLADGGRARIAEYPQYGLDGRWLIEGFGVGPDVEVFNPPHATFNGEDAQLDAAIKTLQEKLRAEPIPRLKPKPLPALGTPGRDVR